MQYLKYRLQINRRTHSGWGLGVAKAKITNYVNGFETISKENNQINKMEEKMIKTNITPASTISVELTNQESSSEALQSSKLL